jgi:antitoxin HicB
MHYPAQFEPAPEGGFVVTFRDIPEAITQGDDEAEALEMAEDALITALDFYFEDRRGIPVPSQPTAGERLIELPPSITAKVLLLNELVNQKISQTELARRMGTTKQEVQRLTDLRHATKIDRLAEALRSVGKHLVLQLI